MREIDEEAAFHHAHLPREPEFQGRRVPDLAAQAIEDVVAAIGDEWLPLVQPQLRPQATGLQARCQRFMAERHDLDRQRHRVAQPAEKFGLVDDDDEALAGGGNDLFPQQRPARPLTKVSPRRST